MSARAVRIGINGFGRIGRQVFRMAVEDEAVEVVHVNDIAHADMLAALLRFDTTHGPWSHRVRSDGRGLWVDDEPISISATEDPARLPWRERGVDVVLEATGVLRERDDAARHLRSGAPKVLVAGPGEDGLDGELVPGVNVERYDPRRHHVISTGGCVIHCLAPLAKVVHEALGIRHGLVTTVFAYTSAPELHEPATSAGPWRWRGRAAAEGLLPTRSTALATLGRIVPALEGRLRALSLQAPITSGSLMVLACTVQRSTRVTEVDQLLRAQAEGPLRGILAVEDAPVASCDVTGRAHSAIVSGPDLQVLGGHLLEILAWCDDEQSYARRCLDLMLRLAAQR